MKFKKLNEHTVECYLTKQDLEDYGISMKDLMDNPEKTNEFVHKIVSMSQKEVDFNPNSSVLQAQIMPYEEGIVMLVFDRPTEKLGEYFLSQLKKRIGESLKKGMDGQKETDIDKETEDNILNLFDEFIKEDGGMPTEMKEALKPGDERCYMFPSFENLMDFIKACPDNCLAYSQLYYQDRTYFLFFVQGYVLDDDFNKVCCLADEFGYMSADCDTRVQLIKEHTKPLIAKDAVGVLKKTIN